MIRLKPQSKWIVGRLIDFDQTAGGVTLATESPQNVTVLLHVDDVGPEVTHCKVGDVVAYRTMFHVNFRDGTRHAVALDEGNNIVAVVEGLEHELERLTIAGRKFSKDERRAADAP